MDSKPLTKLLEWAGLKLRRRLASWALVSTDRVMALACHEDEGAAQSWIQSLLLFNEEVHVAHGQGAQATQAKVFDVQSRIC